MFLSEISVTLSQLISFLRNLEPGLYFFEAR